MSSETARPASSVSDSGDHPVDLSTPSSSSSSEGPALAKLSPGSSGSGSTGDEGESASADDLGLALKSIRPDPFLGEFKPILAESSVPPATDAMGAEFLETLDLDVPPGTGKPAVVDSSSGVSVDISALNLDAADAGPLPPFEGASASHPQETPAPIVAIDLEGPPTSKADRDAARRADEEEEDEDVDLPPRRVSLPVALLASYASAVTIGLLWVLWGHRAPRESAEVDLVPSVDQSADPGRRASQSRRLEPPPPLPADRIVTLGQSLGVGVIEVSPLEVQVVPVVLRREIAGAQVRLGGKDALALRLRLKNISDDSVLSPLDEAFLRGRGRGIHDSYIETQDHHEIDMFPLAVVSEWSIIGQEFRELKPGESYETLIVTAPDALDRLAPGEMTWRLRLRTNINQTETVGIRFRAEDVHRPSGEDAHEELDESGPT